MLSYRHSFHAGNHADVLKHSILVYVLQYMNRKDKPYVYIDTHAGAGVYDVLGQQAQKTGEYLDGIARLFTQEQPTTDFLKPYTDLIASFNTGQNLHYYPGSPAIAQRLLRPSDRLMLTELHGADAANLRDSLGRDRRVHVSQEDGLKYLKAILPPPEKRAVVLIDPSYEIKTDYDLVIRAIQQAVQRFATGTYLLWYPVINRSATESFIAELVKCQIPDMWRLELCVETDNIDRGMTGSGMILINPPYSLAGDASESMTVLHQRLAQDVGQGGAILQRLTEE